MIDFGRKFAIKGLNNMCIESSLNKHSKSLLKIDEIF